MIADETVVASTLSVDSPASATGGMLVRTLPPASLFLPVLFILIIPIILILIMNE
jgi:hypothetical protein